MLGYAAPRVSGVKKELVREVESLIAEAVTRFGVAGQVRIAEGVAVLEGSGATSRVEVGALLEQWDTLPFDIRRRRTNELARQLVGERREAVASAQSKRSFALLGWLTPLLILAGGAALVYLAYLVLAPKKPSPTAAMDSSRAAAPTATTARLDSDDHERGERAARVCNETRARVMRGASVGPADVEGWVVELSILRGGDTPPLEFDPGLAPFVHRGPGQESGSFAWAGAPALAAKSGPMTHVTVEDASLPPLGKPRFRGVQLVFVGRYVTPYFTRSERELYLKTAGSLAERLDASYAALYAHCAGDSTHHIGSWFQGPGPGGAAAALVYFMGTYAPGSQVRQNVLSPNGKLDRAGALQRIAKATKQLDKRRVAMLLGDSGGSVAGRPDGPVTITFPFSEANRAERGSQTIADAVGLSH